MKCDELTIYDDQWCDKSEVEEAIAELKDKLHDVDNQWNEQCKEIAELKAKNRVLQSFYDLHGNVDNYIDQLKAKLESVQASAYADSVDAGMRERRLRRALWLARANSAEGQFFYWCARFGVESGFTKTDIRGYSVNTKWRLRTIGEWIEKWKNVKSKCRAKAEEYR